MALTQQQKRTRNAEYQARWREKRKALVKANPEVAERELIAAAEGCEQLSDAERIALADKLADMANRHLWRAHELAKLAMRVRVPG
jgi:adenine C2-methylase RlmN of 23S rRNA A2503 and tRNA A37